MSARPDLNLKQPMPSKTALWGWLLLIAGVVLLAAGYMTDVRHAAFTNIIVFLSLVSVGVAAIFLIALEYLTGAVWSVPMRRVNEFLGGVIVLAFFAGIPLLLHMHDIFEWTHDTVVVADKLLSAKTPYLNTQFFLIRFGAFFALWGLFYWLLTRNSLQQDATGDQRLTRQNLKLSAGFMPVFAITITFTAVDWAMSLEPHWFSTILGVYYFSGSVLAVLAVTTFAVITLVENGFLPPLKRDHYYNLGALLFVFTNFWAYIAFSQFMLTWYANLPEETFWFMKRWEGGWMWFSIALIIIRFVVPYAVLLPQDAKMDSKRLKFIAIWILGAHLVDLYWLTMPTLNREFTMSWIDVAAPLLVAGAILTTFKFKMGRHNLLPVGDPKLERGLEFHLYNADGTYHPHSEETL
jgi:hypothetical protein